MAFRNVRIEIETSTKKSGRTGIMCRNEGLKTLNATTSTRIMIARNTTGGRNMDLPCRSENRDAAAIRHEIRAGHSADAGRRSLSWMPVLKKSRGTVSEYRNSVEHSNIL